MPTQTRIVAPGSQDREVVTVEGQTLIPPDDWELLPPGDVGLTRRVKASGPTWTVREKRGRKTFSRGVWASRQQIAEVRAALEAERATDAYQKSRESSLRRRERAHREYVASFHEAVLEFLTFAPEHGELAQRVAAAVTEHATPVGSGTVARTQRIPLPERAEAAVIAWLRHRTTAYDQLKIPRVKGKRREVRRQLAARSRQLLAMYRDGGPIDRAACPLQNAIDSPTSTTTG